MKKKINLKFILLKVDIIICGRLFDRSDGKEVIVDNKFLKAHNPVLVITFLFVFAL